MASVNRKSLSLTDVARFNRRFKSYGFTEDAKVKQSFMLTPFDLSECVGPSDSSYPKEPLGPQPGPFEPSIKWSVTALGRHKHGPRKASSATVLTSHQKSSGKRMPLKKSDLSDKKKTLHYDQNKVATKSDDCIQTKVDSTEKMKMKEKKSRIPVSIKALTASKSATQIKQIVNEKPTVLKRHFSSPNLDRNILSKIPVRVTKNKGKDSIEKSSNDAAVKHTSSMVNESSKESLSAGDRQIPDEARSSLLVSENKQPKEKELFGGTTSCNDSSVLVVTFETDSGEETENEKDLSDKVPEKKMKLRHTDVTEEGDNEKTCLQSSMRPLTYDEGGNSNVTEKKKDFESKEKSHQPAVSKVAEMRGPIACYHQSSILLLTCETDFSSESEAEIDLKRKLPQTEDVKPSATDLIESNDSVMNKQESTLESDSGIVLSRVTLVSNQSSLLVLSHDTDCTSGRSTDDELEQASDRNGEPQRVQKEIITVSSDDDWKDDGSPQVLMNNTNNDVTHEPTVCTDNHSSDYSLREENSYSAGSSATTQTEMSEDSQEEKYSLPDKEFLRLAKLLNTTVPSPLNLKECGVQKEKTRRGKRTQQQLARTALETSVLLLPTADQSVSYSLSSSDEEDNELPPNEGTSEDTTELKSYEKEDILLRGQLERFKQTNLTLRSNERTLLKTIKDEAARNGLLLSKSYRLRAQVKSLKRKLKKTGTKSKQREKALKKLVGNLQQKLVSADKLASTLKSALQESENKVAQQTMKLVDEATSEQVVKLQHLEDKLATQQDELQRADQLVSRQNAELQRANEEIEKQKAELRVTDEETVKQLENIQCRFALLEEQDRLLKDVKESSDKQVAKLEEQIANAAQKAAKIEEQLQVERRNSIAFQVQIVELRNDLVASHGIEKQSAKLKEDLELKNQQLSEQNKQLRAEVESANLRFVSAQSELQKVLITRDTPYKQLQQQVTSLENHNSVLKKVNAQLLSNLNTPKREESTQTLEMITGQQDLRLVAASGVSQNNPDTEQETHPDVEQFRSGFSLNTSACAQSNQRYQSRFLWLMECAQLRELLRKLESEHHSLVEKTDKEREMMRSEIDRLSKESLRKDKELDMMESSLEELGKVKNHEIRILKQALMRREEECAMIKEELRQKENKTKIITDAQTKRKWFQGRQQ